MLYDNHETDLDAHLPPLRQGHLETRGNRLLEVRTVRLELTRRFRFPPLGWLSFRGRWRVLMELLFA